MMALRMVLTSVSKVLSSATSVRVTPPSTANLLIRSFIFYPFSYLVLFYNVFFEKAMVNYGRILITQLTIAKARAATTRPMTA